MPRGGMKVKPAKAAKVDVSAPSRAPSLPSVPTKPTRTNTSLLASISTPNFLSRNSHETKTTDQPSPALESSRQQDETREPDLAVDPASVMRNMERDEKINAAPSGLPTELERSVQPTFSRPPSVRFSSEEDINQAALDTLEDLTIEETSSSASSSYSRDSSSIFSKDSSSIYTKDSASIYSSASSISSSGASTYSFDEWGFKELDRYNTNGSTETIAEETEVASNPRLLGGVPYQQRARPVSVRRESQDAAARERSSLAKKAAMFKNSRLRPQLPSFSTSLPTWSMVCRAMQASNECYDSQALVRRGTYTPADTSKDIKAMIVDDQNIDGSRLIIVSVRGTQCQSFSDWAVNKDSKPAKPVGFLDDEENACHAGFLQVTKAMVGQVAAQLQRHPASSERPSLLFTGHSAGGAVSAMLYSHMLSTTLHSDLTALASQFSSVNCVTFGSPPLSLTPLPKRDHVPGVFLTFANEGDPVLRLSNAAYVKSLAKLMTASAPSSVKSAVAPPPVKVVRRSRGSAVVYRQSLPAAPLISWEELPLWPTPPSPLTNAGEVILLRDRENGIAVASRVTAEDLNDAIFADLAQHTTDMYTRRIKELALNAMMGRDVD